MIVARFTSSPNFDRLVSRLKRRFENVQSGQQCDHWIWIDRGGERVAIDTFTSVLFEVKTKQPEGELVSEVLEDLEKRFQVEALKEPEPEPHE